MATIVCCSQKTHLDRPHAMQEIPYTHSVVLAGDFLEVNKAYIFLHDSSGVFPTAIGDDCRKNDHLAGSDEAFLGGGCAVCCLE